ncbi:PrpF domain-containing protein [Enterovirga sp.]|uniref:2-methylaconitate cis-trans isomerase PrpF family protein n=1 Tax=Enterovirga sp. TaxID=2026350 RepID=UPI0026330096|nr:PrpF domain-containing protein [Enterovirga sp.]MDB5590954.1 putative methylitaconate isomerase [Enterovirga sp.]
MNVSGQAEQVAIRCTLLRGGTSKGVYLHEHDIPEPGAVRDRVLKRIMGTPDVMQIDGLGGTHLVTSKIAIIKRSEHPGADIDYTFAQVDIDRDVIDYEGNCGNISAGVGPFAIDAGLVKITSPVTEVRIHNTNTGKLFSARVPVQGGRAKVEGDLAIAGVPGTGAEIFMNYSHTVGAKTGKMLPTENVVDVIRLESGEQIEATLCDVANPCVFVRAADIGLVGDELPERINHDEALIGRLREIRGKAGQMGGLCSDWRKVDEEMALLPMLVFVAEPADYVDLNRETVRSGDMDLRSRLVFLNRCHESMAGTGSMCTAAASRIRGSIVHQIVGERPAEADTLRIGHPLGVMTVKVKSHPANVLGGVEFDGLGFSRTARRILDGSVYVPATTSAG